MAHDLRGRVVVVTGGNAGIGLSMAEGCARAGADLAIWSRRGDRNEAACERLRAHGVRATGFVCDVAEEEQVVAARAQTVSTLGRIDGCIAAAGVFGYQKSIVDVSLERWHSVLRVNLDGVFLTFREVARTLIEQGEGGALVAVSSTSAIHGAQRNHAYGTSKSALLGLTRALAVELARHKIRVNALLPGWTVTELTEAPYADKNFRDLTTKRTPARRWAGPEEFEAIAAYLCDPSLTFHTGDTITVDGGYTIF